MRSDSVKRSLAVITAVVMVFIAGFGVQSAWAGTTTKAEKPKTITLNMVIDSQTDAEVEILIEKINKDKVSSFSRIVSLKKGLNYFTYNKGKKGNYRVSVLAFGDTKKQSVTAVKGSYTVFFKVAPPADGDEKNVAAPKYQDLSKIKQKK